MKCPRCDQGLELFFTELKDNGITVHEYLCMNCLSFVQDVFESSELICRLWGDLR